MDIFPLLCRLAGQSSSLESINNSRLVMVKFFFIVASPYRFSVCAGVTVWRHAISSKADARRVCDVTDDDGEELAGKCIPSLRSDSKGRIDDGWWRKTKE